ncbi:MAG: type II secretion system protein [Candidatus Saccharibacteria bacterium]|nr:type II secretion system protein [Candidatus Saccharibacteria bacterium]
MANKKLNKKEGFTIIEVVLVLAIAGLIFLMVFVALPALQRSQRDTQRRDDMARLATAITTYQTNNNNKLPSNWGDFIGKYLTVNGDTFTDPSGPNYSITSGEAANSHNADNPASKDLTNFEAGKVYVWTNAKCNDEDVIYSQGSRDYAIYFKMEGGGAYCNDNS